MKHSNSWRNPFESSYFSPFGASAAEQAGRTALLVKHLKGAALGLLVAYNAQTFWGAVEGYCPSTGFPIYPGHGPVEVVRSCPAQEVRILYGVNVPAEAGVICTLDKTYGRRARS